jgi:hypothetical protein
MLRRVAIATVVAACVASATTSRALAGEGAAAAEALFAEGKRLAQEGQFAAACPKFEESQKLDPGMGTLYRLADCYEHVGRTASAWAAFLEVASSAKAASQQERADDAKKRADALEPNLAKLVIRVTEPDVAGLIVKRGEIVVGRGQWNTPLPVDPGDVSIEASAPDRMTWRGTAKVAERSSAEIAVPRLDRRPETKTKASPAPDQTPASGDSGLGTQRTLAIVAGVAGLAGIGIGSAFGLVSMSKKSDADGACDANNVCDTNGVAARHDAITAGNVSTVAFIAGAALVTTGAVLWFTAPSSRTTPRAGVAPRWAGVELRVLLP